MARKKIKKIEPVPVDAPCTPETPFTFGVGLESYFNLWCPQLGKPRQTLLCNAFCANTSWSSDHAKCVRKECPSHKLYTEYKSSPEYKEQFNDE